jgi:hypothetical protein
MTHGTHIRKCSPAATVMASAWKVLCRLSATNPWFWLVRAAVFEATATHALVLLHGLPGLLVSIGEGGIGHG